MRLKNTVEIDQSLSILASQSGLPPLLLYRLKNKITQDIGALPISITGWVSWLINWFKLDAEARDLFLFDVRSSVLGATGLDKSGIVTDEVLDQLFQGICAWISGLPLRCVELALGGSPNSIRATNKVCPRARELVSTVLPRGFSFIMGLVTRVVTEVDPFDKQESLSRAVVEALSPAIRLGYDTPEKLAFSFANPEILSRVGVHQEYSQKVD